MLKRVSILDKASDHGNSIFIDDVLEDIYLDDEETRKQFFIYQDIISIWFKLRLERDTKNEFGVTEIGNYLLKHHQPFITEFAGSRITQSNRLQSKRTYLEKRIKDLTKLGILYLKEYTKAKKNNTETPIYEFTLEGKILSWLIVTERTENIGTRTKYIELFTNEFLPLLLKLDSGMFNRVVVDYFMNAIKQDKHEIVYHFFQEVLSLLDKNNLYTVRFTFLRFISTMDDDASRLFLYTLYSYDKKIQELLLFQIKMDLECSIELFMNGEFKYDWEVRRHQNIENPHIITTAMSCTKCDSQYDVSQVELLVFLGVKKFDELDQKTIDLILGDFKCKRCGSKSGYYLGFFDLLDKYYLLDNDLRAINELI